MMSTQIYNPQVVWVSAQLIAGKPGVPGTTKGVRECASRQGWIRRSTRGRGGYREEYQLESLPKETQREILHGASVKAAFALAEVVSEDTFEVPFVDKDELLEMGVLNKRIIVARMNVCTAYATARSILPAPVDENFESLYKARRLAGILPDTYALIDSVTARTVRNWSRALKNEGSSGLGDDRYGGRDQTALTKEQYTWCRDVLRTHPAIDAVSLHRELQEKFEQEFSLRTIQRTFARLEKEDAFVLAARRNKAKFLNSHRPKFGIAKRGAYPNEIWMIDTTPNDVWAMDNSRGANIRIIDTCTDWIFSKVVERDTADALITTVCAACATRGVPKFIDADNGSQFRSYAFVNFCLLVGITIRYCDAYSPWQKSFIERAIGTANKSLRALNGYLGRSPEEGKALREGAMGFTKSQKKRSEKERDFRSNAAGREELQAHFEKHDKRRNSTKKRRLGGLSPDQYFDKYLLDNKLSRPSISFDDLRLLAAPGAIIEKRTIGTEGIKVHHRKYGHVDLVGRVGQTVEITYAWKDGKGTTDSIVVRGEGLDSLIVPCTEVLSKAEQIKLANDAGKSSSQKLRESDKETKKINLSGRALIEEAAKRLAKPSKADVTALPGMYDAIAPRSKATSANKKHVVIDSHDVGSPDQLAKLDALKEMKVHQIRPMDAVERSIDRMDRFIAAITAFRSGDGISDKEMSLVNRYPKDPEFRRMCVLFPEKMGPYKELGLAASNG